MREGIHPKYEEITMTCSCGNKIKTRSTHPGDLHIDICSSCHPFYTNEQKIVDTLGRVEKFKNRYKFKKDSKAEPEAKAEAKIETKTEAKTVTKPKTKTEAKPETKTETKPEDKAE